MSGLCSRHQRHNPDCELCAMTVEAVVIRRAYSDGLITTFLQPSLDEVLVLLVASHGNDVVENHLRRLGK